MRSRNNSTPAISPDSAAATNPWEWAAAGRCLGTSAKRRNRRCPTCLDQDGKARRRTDHGPRYSPQPGIGRESLRQSGADVRGCIRRTSTAMAGRMLRRWMHRPVRDRAMLRARYQAVAKFDGRHPPVSGSPITALIGDLERIFARIALRSARPRDLAHLRAGLVHASLCRTSLPCVLETPSPLLEPLLRGPRRPSRGARVAEPRVVDSPPHFLRDGGVIARRIRCRARRTTASRQQYRAVPDGSRASRARAHRPVESQAGIQPRAGILHRGESFAATPSPRISAAPDGQILRAIHHPRAQVVRGQGSGARDERSAARKSCTRRCSTA